MVNVPECLNLADVADFNFPQGDGDSACFCVVGSPIQHSRSPQIHRAFATTTDIKLVYGKVEVAAGQLLAAVTEFKAHDGRGMNVTVPLKEEAFALAHSTTPRAAAAAAANTLVFKADGSIHADNTDGAGLVGDLLRNHAIDITGRNIFLLGAGGAARGVLPALLAEQPQKIFLTNRTASKATEVAAGFGDRPIECVRWGEAPPVLPDLIINATSLSLSGEVPPLPAKLAAPACVFYDMMYADEPTVFLRWAEANGAQQLLDGLGMLVEQAAEAFYVWHGVRPQTQPVIKALRAGSL